RDDNFIDHAGLELPVHRDIVEPFQALQAAAAEAGFDLAIASGYRNYQRQLQIWNAKARGERAVYADDGTELDMSMLSERERVFAILRWSALPGVSRHHWGTDIDVYDRAAVPQAYVVQLSGEEVADTGPFGPLHRWLDERIASDRAFGFFRPYQADRGGVAPERWHLSYAPLAARYQRCLKLEALWPVIDSPALALRDTIAENWPAIFERFVWVPPQFYPEALRERVVGASDQG
ncbi:MAG TPA: M15 family metallopeptidase, partial [Spongiibacteraceae bacterium]|nr:M15 family metallopeptidase [Spongiibacteraceae bacterium]